ncbi:MAG: hypothetical protein K0U24_07770 [Gammaproteobacteria bacterium]|nr:hypothetical protein [Gammaproteobacteria bacterium]MCH9764097.1 hypothetical protein [Gammaproteobacteria bacterium]
MISEELKKGRELCQSLKKYHEWLQEQAKGDLRYEGQHDDIIYHVNQKPEYTAVAEVVGALIQDLDLAFNTYSNSKKSLRGANRLSKSITCAFDTALADPVITTHSDFIKRCYQRFQKWLKTSFDIDIAKAAPTEQEEKLQGAGAGISVLITQAIESRLEPNQTLEEGLRQEKADRRSEIKKKAVEWAAKMHAEKAEAAETTEVTSSEWACSDYLPLAIEYPLGVASSFLLSIAAVLGATMDEQCEDDNSFRP